MSHIVSHMALDQKDLELIERMVFKSADDVAVSVARSFERMEERIDATEARMFSRLSDLESKIEDCHNAIADELGSLHSEPRRIADEV